MFNGLVLLLMQRQILCNSQAICTCVRDSLSGEGMAYFQHNFPSTLR